MKDEGFTPQNMGEITPRNGGFGFPWTLKIEFSANVCCFSFPPVALGGRSVPMRFTNGFGRPGQCPSMGPFGVSFFFCGLEQLLGIWGGIKKTR